MDALDPDDFIAPPLVPELRVHARPERLLGPAETSVEPPYWSTVWVGGSALARFVLDRPEVVRGRAVMDFGTGAGVVALAAAHTGAARVLGVDRDAFALRVLALNAHIADLQVETACTDPVAAGETFDDFEVVLAADVLYAPHAAAGTWLWLMGRARAGRRVFVADPGRGHLPAEERVLVAEIGLPRGVTVSIYELVPETGSRSATPRRD